MYNLHHLQIFYTVAACESYSRAAERLGISQPAVSMQVKKLEEAAGVPLVVSRGRQIQLTEAGVVLADYASRIFRLGDEAVQAMADFREMRRGRLRVAASSTPGAYLLPGAIASFRAECPGVTVSMEISNTRSALRLVAEGLADLAIAGDADADGQDVVLEPLCTDQLVVVAPPGHLWTQLERVTPSQLAAEPLLLREEGSSTREVLGRRLDLLGLRPKLGMELGSTEAVKEAVMAGLGPAVLSGLAVRREVADGRMVRLKVADLDLSRTLRLVLPGSGAGTLAGQFVRHLREYGLAGEGCP